MRQNYHSFKMIRDKSLSEKVINYAQETEMKIMVIAPPVLDRLIYYEMFTIPLVPLFEQYLVPQLAE